MVDAVHQIIAGPILNAGDGKVARPMSVIGIYDDLAVFFVFYERSDGFGYLNINPPCAPKDQSAGIRQLRVCFQNLKGFSRDSDLAEMETSSYGEFLELARNSLYDFTMALMNNGYGEHEGLVIQFAGIKA